VYCTFPSAGLSLWVMSLANAGSLLKVILNCLLPKTMY
jgi:hypothetical protein